MTNILKQLLETSDYDKINSYIKSSDALLDKLVAEVIKSNNPRFIYEFTLNVPGIDANKMADAIIKTKNVEYIYNYAKDIKGAPIGKLADGIVKTKNAEYIYNFAKNIAGAPVYKLAEGIIKTNDVEYIYDYAKDIGNAPIDKLGDAIIAKEDANVIFKFMIEFLSNPDLDIKKYANAIIETGDAKIIYKLAMIGLPEEIVSLDDLENAVIESNNALIIKSFAETVKGANIEKLADAIIDTEDAKYICNFAYLGKDNIPVEKLAEKLIDMDEKEYIKTLVIVYEHKFFDNKKDEKVANIYQNLIQLVCNYDDLETFKMIIKETKNASLQKYLDKQIYEKEKEVIENKEGINIKNQYAKIFNSCEGDIDKIEEWCNNHGVDLEEFLSKVFGLRNTPVVKEQINEEQNIGQNYGGKR